MTGFRTWAMGLAVAVLMAGCGGGGGDDKPSTPPPVATVGETAVTLSASDISDAPVTSVSLTATNMPKDGLYVIAYGNKGYVTVDFDGYNLVITGANPASLPVGTYQDSVTVKVCYDDHCAKQIPNSPLSVAVSYTVSKGDPAVATPRLASLSPPSVVQGSAGFTLALAGQFFAPTSVVLWNGQPLPTTYVSSNSLQAQIDASYLVNVTSAYITVSNTSTGGGISLAQQFQVTAPVPVVASVQPATVGSGGSAFTLVVDGSGFDPTAQVYWNGSVRTTTVVSATQVTARITAADIAAAASIPVTVVNGDGALVSSNAATVTVADLPLSLAALAPTFVTAGGPAYNQIVVGTGFDPSATVQWNGAARPTTFLSTTQLKVWLGAADIAATGSGSLTVVNAGTHPGTSGAQVLPIVAPTAGATAFQVNPQHNGAAHFASIVGPTALPSSPLWSAQLDGTAGYPLIAGGRVFVVVSLPMGGSELVALSAASGDVIWGPVALPSAASATYDNGRVIVMNSNGTMAGYDAATGTPLWSTAMAFQWSFTAPPTAANGIAYTGGAGDGGTLYAVDDTTGAPVWSAGVMNGDASSPTVTASGVYVTYPCQTYAFQPLTGAPVWHDGGPCEGGGGQTGAFANGLYYSPNGDGATGSQVFDGTTGQLLSGYPSSGVSPAIGTTTGYFPYNGTIQAVDLASGNVVWTFGSGLGLVTSPILVNGYVFVGSAANKVYALDAATGATLWQAALGSAPNGSSWMQLGQGGLSAGDGLLLVPAGNTVQAFPLSNNP